MDKRKGTPTPAQLRVLKNLYAGLSPRHGLHGMSEMGGLHRTLFSMRQRGWLSKHDALTTKGVAVLDSAASASLGRKRASGG